MKNVRPAAPPPPCCGERWWFLPHWSCLRWCREVWVPHALLVFPFGCCIKWGKDGFRRIYVRWSNTRGCHSLTFQASTGTLVDVWYICIACSSFPRERSVCQNWLHTGQRSLFCFPIVLVNLNHWRLKTAGRVFSCWFLGVICEI